MTIAVAFRSTETNSWGEDDKNIGNKLNETR